ncbi:MAG: radical SAM protein [Thermodesulfobacteriota bacterium]
MTRRRRPAAGGLHPAAAPSLVYANSRGEILDAPDLAMAGRSGRQILAPARQDLIPLPPGSELFALPERLPVGLDRASGRPQTLTGDPLVPGEPVQAVAAFLAPAHTAILTAPWHPRRPELPALPLFAYTAVGWHAGRFWVAAFRSDPEPRQDPDRFDLPLIRRRTTSRLSREPDNRLLQHLGHCCLTYGCPAARNLFLSRWEAPLPTSPSCNARCLGCISLQPAGCCPSTQERIRFRPTEAEVLGVALPHLEKASRPVVSFGQGCEGEPLLGADLLAGSVQAIRRATSRGTVNLNSNASRPEAVARLAAAGLDSLRVSLNSARPDRYQRYYRPQDYDFGQVLDSIRTMKAAGRFVSLNYFILPGFSDQPAELAALSALIADLSPDLIQLRNLNMDPDWYLAAVGEADDAPGLGIRAWLAELRRRFPHLRFGYFNPFLGDEPQNVQQRMSKGEGTGR